MQVCDKYNIDSKSRNFSAWESENWNLYEKNETTESKSQCEILRKCYKYYIKGLKILRSML